MRPAVGKRCAVRARLTPSAITQALMLSLLETANAELRELTDFLFRGGPGVTAAGVANNSDARESYRAVCPPPCCACLCSAVPLQRSISVLWPVSRLCGASVQTDPPPGTVQVENQFALYQFIEISTKLQTIRMHGWWRQALSCASLSQSLPRRPDASQRTHACIHASIRERSTLTM